VIHLDTSFLIDLHRELAHKRPGGAMELIETFDENEILAISVFAACELRAGAERARNPAREHTAIDELLSGLLVVNPDDQFASMYARHYRASIRNHRPIAAMDLLIATAAVQDDAPLVTRNTKDFSRIPGLRVIGY